MKRQSAPAKGELTEEEQVNAHVPSRDSWAYAVALVREPTVRAEACEWSGSALQRREN